MSEIKTAQQYFSQFKEDVQKKTSQLCFQQEKQKIQELLEYIYEYPPYLNESNSQQTNPQPPKKRDKPPVTQENRCMAKLSNGGQCSRQRLKEGRLCGSHNKVQPYGLVSISLNTLAKIQAQEQMLSHEVFAVEIQGLVYYIDHGGNVFRTEDVLNDVPNPSIIAKYIKTETGYSIPSLGLV